MNEGKTATGVIVEAVRLLVTLTTTAAGFLIARRLVDGSATDREIVVVGGAVFGAGVGYVAGGALGRLSGKLLVDMPKIVRGATAPQLFGGAFGVGIGLMVATLLSVPLVVFLPTVVGWLLSGLLLLLTGSFSARLFAVRSDELLASLRPQPMEQPPRLRAVSPEAVGSFVVDSSAAIDGRVLDLARAAILQGTVAVPEFVIDELQGIADSGEKSRRRRGRRGLDVLDALRLVEGVNLTVLDDTVPMHAEVDAKLIALCDRHTATLVTTDHNLGRAAELRGVQVLNPHSLGEALRPMLMKGDRVELRVEREGSEPGQGVGFLEDGTMVVIEDGAQMIGQTVPIEIANSLRTSVGRMMFAKLAS
jgi:uncharacterized protein YacL